MSEELARAERLVGRVLGDKFKLRACIGIGGSGTVFMADQMALGRTVAVKILAEELAGDPRLVRRFHDEALAASRLNHPNTVSVIDYGQSTDGLLYLVMEYVRGPTLTQLLSRDFPIAHDRVLDILGQILAGIEEAHLAGVVHADLKSDNIILDQRRAGWDVVKVVDFGIARLVTAPRDGDDRSICGTPEYMAPEIITGAPPTFASDLYAVGIVLHELLVGETPFAGGSTIDILTRQLKSDPLAPSARRPDLKISDELDGLCLRALAKRPHDRWVSAAEMRAEVLHLREQRTKVAVPVTDQVTCAQCGAASSSRFRFCPECGAPRDAAIAPVPAAPGAAPAPVASIDASIDASISLIGRDALLERLVLHLSAHQSPSPLLLVGAPGADRTVIVREACERVAETAGVTVYQTGADPTGLASAFYPIRALVAAVLLLPPVCSFDDLARAVESAGLAARDVPGIAELFAQESELWELEPQVRRRELIASTLRVLRAAADRGPVAIVFEDVERYDDPSVEIVRRLVEGAAGDLEVLLSLDAIAASRWPETLPRAEVDPLDGDAVGALAAHLQAVGFRGMPRAVTLTELTGGAPAHVDHLVHFLSEGGTLDSAPSTLPDLVAARLSMLPHPSLVLCQVAAAFGLEADRDLLRQACGGHIDGPFDAAVGGLTMRGLARDDGATVAFASPLVRDVAYDATPADVRRALHAAAADVLSTVTSDPAVLGHHRDLAGQRDEAAELLARAGDLAVHQHDDAGASFFYQRALTAARQTVYSGADDEASVRRFIVLAIKLADSLRVAGEVGLARGVLAEARPWSDSTATLDAQLTRATAHLSLTEGDLAGGAATLRKAIGHAIAAGDGELITEMYLDLSSVLMRTGDLDGARRELSECLDMVTLGEGAGARSGPDSLWRAIMRLAQIADGAGEVGTAAELGEHALVHARRVRSRLGSARVQSFLASVCERAGQTAKAERYRQAAVEEMRKLGDRRGTAELLLATTSPTRTIPRVSPQLLGEARDLAREVGWSEGSARAGSEASEA
jgi:tetratricopeptide (TPR) repeat protein